MPVRPARASCRSRRRRILSALCEDDAEGGPAKHVAFHEAGGHEKEGEETARDAIGEGTPGTRGVEVRGGGARREGEGEHSRAGQGGIRADLHARESRPLKGAAHAFLRGIEGVAGRLRNLAPPHAAESRLHTVREGHGGDDPAARPHSLDRESTRLNSSHLGTSYAVFCLKKKNN